MNIFKKIPAVIASVAVIVSLSAVAVSANSYVPEVSDVVTEDIEVVFDSATKAQREQAQQIIADLYRQEHTQRHCGRFQDG